MPRKDSRGKTLARPARARNSSPTGRCSPVRAGWRASLRWTQMTSPPPRTCSQPRSRSNPTRMRQWSRRPAPSSHAATRRAPRSFCGWPIHDGDGRIASLLGLVSLRAAYLAQQADVEHVAADRVVPSGQRIGDGKRARPGGHRQQRQPDRAALSDEMVVWREQVEPVVLVSPCRLLAQKRAPPSRVAPFVRRRT